MNTKDKDYKAYLNAYRLYETTRKAKWYNPESAEFGEAKRLLYSRKFYKFPYHAWSTTGLKPYAKIRNRKDRAHTRMTISFNMMLEDNFDYYEKEFRYSHKHSAKWDRF